MLEQTISIILSKFVKLSLKCDKQERRGDNRGSRWGVKKKKEEKKWGKKGWRSGRGWGEAENISSLISD